MNIFQRQLVFRFASVITTTVVFPSVAVHAHEVIYDSPRMYHLRADGPREWSDFPERADATNVSVDFDATEKSARCALRIRQQDVKQTWNVTLNEKKLGALRIDENDMVVYFEIPAGTVVDGKNTLR
ncbi:MAG: hypothetical protein KDB27_31235, partial [Planctomycetales bacterium]|nr:hypothetical protein [Planctomycetales bacterium]